MSQSQVRAKFFCESIKDDTSNSEAKHVALRAVYDESEDNKNWSKYTPNGNCNLTITNPNAYEKFEVGEEYYLDFTKVESNNG